jgi:hypothetical protein
MDIIRTRAIFNRTNRICTIEINIKIMGRGHIAHNRTQTFGLIYAQEMGKNDTLDKKTQAIYDRSMENLSSRHRRN